VQFASFDLADPVFEAFGLRWSVQVVTLENLYGLDPARCELERSGDVARLRASGLAWAGQQERAPGELELRLERQPPGRVRATLAARAPERIRCVKLLLRDLETPLALRRESGAWQEVGRHGELVVYPRQIPVPLLVARAGGQSLAACAEDAEVREKRFALFPEPFGPLAGRGCLELIHEEAASRFRPEIEAPPFVIHEGSDPEAVLAEHLRFAEARLGLVPWQERSDVPDWARELALVATLHGMHWTGRVLLDYAAMQEVLRFLAERTDASRVLIYLPGWEGRYYWRYGDYGPDARLGGEAGFARLCDEARRLGFHLMPMFGLNCVNARLERFRGLDDAVFLKSATGLRFHGNVPDWDLARAHDPGWQAWLNPGHPVWRDELAGQIEALSRRFGFEAVFLDTSEIWTNDRDHPVHDGIRLLVERLRAALPGVLLAGEYDYDALLPLFPLFQRAWWTPAPAWTARYARRFAHLCEGEPGGRTGVHELGTFRPGPVEGALGLLPTLAFQDGTLVEHRPALEAFLNGLELSS
jgi:hypothetical protein